MTNNSKENISDGEAWEKVGLSEPTEPTAKDACPHCGSVRINGQNLCGTESGRRSTECYLWEKLQKSEAEVERLRANLRRAIEIAEGISIHSGWNYTKTQELTAELDQLKATLNQDNK